MYKILEKQRLSDAIVLMTVEAPHVARSAKPGQFVIVIADEQGERIPLTIADHDKQAGTITLVIQEIGKSTKQMGAMAVGEGFYSVAGPLGHPTEIESARHGGLRGGRRGHRADVPDRTRAQGGGQPRHLDHRRAQSGAALLGRQDALGLR